MLSINRNIRVQQNMMIKNITTSNRGPWRSSGKVLKIYECSNFFDPPPLEYETFLPPPLLGSLTLFHSPFWSFKTFLTPTKFSSPPPRYLWTLPYILKMASVSFTMNIISSKSAYISVGMILTDVVYVTVYHEHLQATYNE